MIIRPVIKPQEKSDMSSSQSQQIRERFLVKSRAHLLHTDPIIDPITLRNGTPASIAGHSVPCPGKSAN